MHVTEVKKPALKAGSLLTKVHAAEVSKAYTEMRSFKFPLLWFWLPLRLAIGITAPRKKVLGNYFAGTVEEVGADVTKYKIGDAIFGATGIGFGAHGEYVYLPENSTLALKPDNIDFATPAAAPMGGLNALHFMRLAKIKTGDKVLVNGAGGSIGMFAVQIAMDMGAEVSVVDSAHKKEMLTGLGIVNFYDYTKENFADSDQVFDVFFDMLASSSFTDCVSVLAHELVEAEQRLGTIVMAISNE